MPEFIWPPPTEASVFESLCFDLWKEIWGPDSGAKRHGRAGQAQAGVDFFGLQGDSWIGVQCRLRPRNLKATELDKAVESARLFQPALSSLLVATTSPRDAKVQQRAREISNEQAAQGLFRVEVWFWEDIWQEIFDRPKLLERIGRKYWPTLLGLQKGRSEVASARKVIFLDYSRQIEQDRELAESLRRRLIEGGYLPVGEVHPSPEEIANLGLDFVIPQPAAAIRIVSASALSAGFSFRSLDDLPMFTIGIREGSPPEPFAADVMWDASIRLEGGESAGTDRQYVLQAAMDFVESATVQIRGVGDQGTGRDSVTVIKEPGTAPIPGEPPVPPPIHDPTPLHLDTPAIDDRLGRIGIARALAVRLERIWREMNRKKNTDPDHHASQGSFALHLHGEWGSGKSSLLKMLRRELKRRPTTDADEPEPVVAVPWAVVDFNAWQNQRLDPPWWPLFDGIYRQSLGQIPWWRAVWCWLREQTWRFATKRRDLMIFSALLVLCALLCYRFLHTVIPEIKKGVGEAGDTASHISDIAALGALVGGWLWFGSRSLVSGSARAAQSFVQSVADPMDRIQSHFTKMVGAIGRPIAVFVDDLDRCQADYVVKLLEGIQTLFRDPRVVYVVAADQRWLHACFERMYEPFADSVREPGRRLGSLFLEKAFEISVEMPRLSKGVLAKFWSFLLGGDPGDAEARITKLEQEARIEFAGATSEQQVISRLERPDSSDADPLRENIRRQVAVEHLANAAVEQSVTYFLQPFAPLLEPNPRSMKRFLNAYAIQRDFVNHLGPDDPLTLDDVSSLLGSTTVAISAAEAVKA